MGTGEVPIFFQCILTLSFTIGMCLTNPKFIHFEKINYCFPFLKSKGGLRSPIIDWYLKSGPT